MLSGFASWLLHTVAQFCDPIVMQVLSTAKSCLSRLSLVCQSTPPPSLQALGEMLLDNTNENVIFVIASTRRMAPNSSGLVIGVHGVTIQNSGIKKKNRFRPRSNLDRLDGQPIQIRQKKTKKRPCKLFRLIKFGLQEYKIC
jgi:hypothetical protein